MHARLVSSQLDVFWQTLLTPMAQVKSLASFYQAAVLLHGPICGEGGSEASAVGAVGWFGWKGENAAMQDPRLAYDIITSMLRYWPVCSWDFGRSCCFTGVSNQEYQTAISNFFAFWTPSQPLPWIEVSHHIKAGSLPQRTWGLNMTII